MNEILKPIILINYSFLFCFIGRQQKMEGIIIIIILKMNNGEYLLENKKNLSNYH